MSAATILCRVLLVTVAVSPSLPDARARAQAMPFADVPVPFLIQAQSRGIKQNVQVAVQQAISALPPTGGQAIVWDLKSPGLGPALAPWERTARLGPISFRTPEIVPAQSFSARLALSYFDLSEHFAPVAYVGTGPELRNISAATELGLDVDATAAIVSLSSTYGISDAIDLSLNVPITFVRAKASSIFTTLNAPQYKGMPRALAFMDTSPADAVGLLDAGVAAGLFVFDQADTSTLGGVLETGTQVGLGRIGITAKELLVSETWLTVSLAGEISLPSPSSDALAGTDSFGALPRLILAAPLYELGRLHVDAGYEFDTEFKELWRAVWNVGASIWIGSGVIDFGFGGSKYLQELRWSPPELDTVARVGTLDVRTNWVAQSDTGVGGTNYVDFLAGAKYEVATRTVLGGSVSVPITSDGLRPTAIATLALEYYF